MREANPGWIYFLSVTSLFPLTLTLSPYTGRGVPMRFFASLRMGIMLKRYWLFTWATAPGTIENRPHDEVKRPKHLHTMSSRHHHY